MSQNHTLSCICKFKNPLSTFRRKVCRIIFTIIISITSTIAKSNDQHVILIQIGCICRMLSFIISYSNCTNLNIKVFYLLKQTFKRSICSQIPCTLGIWVCWWIWNNLQYLNCIRSWICIFSFCVSDLRCSDFTVIIVCDYQFPWH